MSSIERSVSSQSTESFDSVELEEEDKIYSIAPHDIIYEDPGTGDSLLVLKKVESVPVLQSKYKGKKRWPFLLRFRYLDIVKLVCFPHSVSTFSIVFLINLKSE